IEMAVSWDGERAAYGGTNQVFAADRELSFENDWIPNRGWGAPTYVTLRLTPAPGGTLVEPLHPGLERPGGDHGAAHAGDQTRWGMTQLQALKALVEGSG